ncbi:MAG: MFS transporter [Sulfobacillus acidophilus]|uniref:MFS transporter n=1 Tax=Sulfobacillus acidophilus TaxID=53633 RepID=A0A2T2WHT2_9FIRM|nr:MAG: MFS transporter [Sulfobacillus acidophilus]
MTDRRFWGITASQAFWLILAALAWFIESYDIGLMSVVLLPFKQLFHLTGSDTGLLVASAAVGIVIGVVPSGFLADRLGRKRLLIASLIWYSLLTFVTGFAPGWQVVLLLRFFAGLGLGAMFPLPYTLLAELSPKQARGRVAGILDAFLSVGYFAAPLVGGWIMGTTGLLTGWRILFFLGGIGLVYAGILGVWLPESPRWLRSQGRGAEAELILAKIGSEAREEIESVTLDRPPRRPYRVVFSRGYRRRTVMLWIAFPSILFVFYAIMNFMPTILSKEHITGPLVLEFAALIMAASVPGKFFEAWVVERVGRKPVIVGFTLIAAAAALLFPAARSTLMIVGMGMVLAFFGVAVDPAVKIYTAEQYPTAIRGTGVGLAEGMARLLGGALAPYIMAVMLSSSGIRGSFVFVAAVACFGALAVAVLGRETKGQVLEERKVGERVLVGSASAGL